MDELLRALTRAWDAIRARHDEVPPVVLAVGSHRRTAQLPCLGGFVPGRWSPAHAREPPQLQALREEFDDAIACGDLVAALGASGEMVLVRALQLSADAGRFLDEVFITDRGLSGSSAEVLGILAHEACHAIAERRGVKDTSRQGRYHNARFRALAEEVGLEVRGHPVIGCRAITLTAATAAVYTDTLAELARALDAHRKQGPSVVVRAGGVLRCECGAWLRGGRRGMPRLRAAACGICGARVSELAGRGTA